LDTTDRKLPRLTAFYIEYLKEHDTYKFVEQTAKYYNEAALIRLTGSRHPETRRAAAQLLGFLGTYQSNEVLGHLLKDPDRSVRLLAESSMKSIWTREGSDHQRHELHEIMRLIAMQQFGEAVRHANNLLDLYPLYIEARNQRAIALFAQQKFQESIEDSTIVLDLNPFHFGAAIGMGHAYLQLQNKDLAVACFQHALEINPNLDMIRRHLERLLQSRIR
jgi:tetratricopeptide (TPR) repeat protein